MNVQYIEKVVGVVVKDHRVLAVLGKGQSNWHIPTTEKENVETDIEALTRYFKNELNVAVKEGSVKHFGTFDAHAHAHGMNFDKTNKAEVRLHCYLLELTGELQLNPNLEKFDFLWSNQKHLLTQTYFAVMDELQKKNFIE